MAFYTVSSEDPNTLTHDQLREEVDSLKRELASIESTIAEKKAWSRVPGASAPDFETWMAKSLNFRSRLVKRYMQLKPILTAVNRSQREDSSQ
jgi:hypothetical protein